jgi:membrane-associated phospholipid phosphatase
MSFLIPVPSRAQSRTSMLVSDVKSSAGDAWDVWTSPFRGDARDWLTAGGVLAAGAAVSTLDDAVDRWAVRNAHDGSLRFLDPVRPGGFAFSGKTITPVAASALVLSVAFRNQSWQDGVFGCATSYAASSVVRTFVVYPLVARTRPDSSRGATPSPPAAFGDQYHFSFPGTTDWGRHAFPGGHVANISACVEFLSRRYHLGYVEPALWLVVGGVGVGRALDRAHWTSDQIVGVLFGYAVGKEVALRSLRRTKRLAADGEHTRAGERDSDPGSLFFDPSGNAVRLGWKRTF